MPHVCPWWFVWTFDNPVRNLIHNIEKIYSPYIKPGMEVLDIGCGGGFTTLRLARLLQGRGHVHAVDMQAAMLSMTQKRAKKFGVADRIVLHQCRQDSLDITVAVDFANVFWVAHEVPDIQEFLKQIFGNLKPGGRLLITEPKIHVSAHDFEKTIQVAQALGFKTETPPNIAFSITMLFKK
ncbi:class I SAM-dependent methyltransferase [bacterium]|nr:class I SAM-dependent methyltransferase [bacterium]